jgi:hypothetical protein
MRPRKSIIPTLADLGLAREEALALRTIQLWAR